MPWWLLWSCSPQLTAPAAMGSAVMFDTEAQADTLVMTKVVEQAPRYPVPPTASVLGSDECNIEFWTGVLAWYHWLPSGKEPAFGYKTVFKSSTATLMQHRKSLPLGQLCQAGNGGWCLCHASVGCWAWSISTLSSLLADNGQREMVPLLTDQAVWKKVSDKLLGLSCCLLPVKALAGVQQWTCWSYGPVLPSLLCIERESISGFAELPCFLSA